MNVAFIARATLYTSPGGDTRQIESTAGGLSQMGISVTVLLANERIAYEQYDLLHFFNIIRPADILRHTARSKVPFVVSTIFVDYSDYEKRARTGMLKWLGRVASADQLEWLKTIARRIKNKEKTGSLRYVMLGHRRAVRYVAQQAAMLLPNSESEYQRFVQQYKISRPYRVIPNGINAALAANTTGQDERYQDAILCVGRIEGRKNQLNLIRAMNGSSHQVFIIGKASPNHAGYYRRCQQEAAENIHFVDWVEEQALFRIYRAAKVHVLPSYFETTGLSSLEAAVMGCNIVVSPCGDTRDYFKEEAWYCEPDNIDSIRTAIINAYNAPYCHALRSRILSCYTWERAALETLTAYQSLPGKA